MSAESAGITMPTSTGTVDASETVRFSALVSIMSAKLAYPRRSK